MKNNKSIILRQYIGNFLVALMLVISFLSGPATSEASSKSHSSTPELNASSTITDFEFTQIKSLKGNFVKIPTFSKVAEKLSEQTHVIFNEIYFIPYPQTLTVNTFSRNVFYVFISTKAP